MREEKAEKERMTSFNNTTQYYATQYNTTHTTLRTINVGKRRVIVSRERQLGAAWAEVSRKARQDLVDLVEKMIWQSLCDQVC